MCCHFQLGEVLESEYIKKYPMGDRTIDLYGSYFPYMQ